MKVMDHFLILPIKSCQSLWGHTASCQYFKNISPMLYDYSIHIWNHKYLMNISSYKFLWSYCESLLYYMVLICVTLKKILWRLDYAGDTLSFIVMQFYLKRIWEISPNHLLPYWGLNPIQIYSRYLPTSLIHSSLNRWKWIVLWTECVPPKSSVEILPSRCDGIRRYGFLGDDWD